MKASVYIAVTVDGFIATKDGGVGFLDAYQQSPPPKPSKYDFESFLSTVDVLIMGRKSFEKVLSFGPDVWPYGTRRVVVRTRRPNQNTVVLPSHLSSEQVAFSNQAPHELVQDLKKQGLKHAYIDGGQTIQQFLQAGLVQQLVLTRVPVLLGQGIPLFSSSSLSNVVPLQHEESVDLGNGLVTSCYTVISAGNKEEEEQ